jgi:hypothetical protein
VGIAVGVAVGDDVGAWLSPAFVGAAVGAAVGGAFVGAAVQRGTVHCSHPLRAVIAAGPFTLEPKTLIVKHQGQGSPSGLRQKLLSSPAEG